MVDKLEACAECGMTGALCSSSDGEVAWIRCQYCRREGPLAYSAKEAVRGWNAGEERSKPTPANGEQVERADREVVSWIAAYLRAGNTEAAFQAAAKHRAATPTEDARSRVKVQPGYGMTAAEATEMLTTCSVETILQTMQEWGMIRDATALGNKETDRHG